MKILSNEHNTLESKSLRSKVKEIAAISLFIVIAAAASIFLADIIVFPLTHFAVRRVDIFNLIFKNMLLLIVLVFLCYTLIKKYRKLIDEGLSGKNIAIYFLKRPLHYGSLILSFLFISSLLITILYLLFNLNYYYLYKISGGI